MDYEARNYGETRLREKKREEGDICKECSNMFEIIYTLIEVFNRIKVLYYLMKPFLQVSPLNERH